MIPTVVFTACIYQPPASITALIMQAQVDSIPKSWKDDPVILLADSVRIDFKCSQNTNSAEYRECWWYYVNKRNPSLLDFIEIYDYEFVETAPQITVDIIYPDGQTKSISSWEIKRFKPYDDQNYSSAKMKNLISIPKYQEKMLMRVEVVRNFTRPAYLSVEYLRGEYHCLQKNITLSWPSDIQLNCRILNNEGLKIDTSRSMTDSKNTAMVLGKKLQKFPLDQRLRYPEQWFAGLHLSLPPVGKRSLSWQELGDNYLELINPSLVSSPEIKKLAASINDTGREAIVRKAFQLVQKNIRYLADEEKMYAIVPRPASEILAKGYGDCKEMAALLKVILEEKGIPSHLALVTFRWKFQVIDSIPVLGGFDHIILYVPAFDHSPVFLDPTVDYGHVKNSYYHCMYQKAFILEKGRSRLSEIMPRDGEGKSIVKTGSVIDRSKNNGSWEMRGTVVLQDNAAFLTYPMLKELKGEENNPGLIGLLKSMFTIDPISVSCKQLCADSITIGFSCNVNKNYLKIDKGGFLLDAPSIFGGPSVFTTIKREGPRVFEQLDQKDSWTLPEGFVELEITALAHQIASGAWGKDGRVVSRTFTLNRVIVPPSQSEESTQFLRQKDNFLKATVWQK